jgi:hypothetical protein
MRWLLITISPPFSVPELLCLPLAETNFHCHFHKASLATDFFGYMLLRE